MIKATSRRVTVIFQSHGGLRQSWPVPPIIGIDQIILDQFSSFDHLIWCLWQQIRILSGLRSGWRGLVIGWAWWPWSSFTICYPLMYKVPLSHGHHLLHDTWYMDGCDWQTGPLQSNPGGSIFLKKITPSICWKKGNNLLQQLISIGTRLITSTSHPGAKPFNI